MGNDDTRYLRWQVSPRWCSHFYAQRHPRRTGCKGCVDNFLSVWIILSGSIPLKNWLDFFILILFAYSTQQYTWVIGKLPQYRGSEVGWNADSQCESEQGDCSWFSLCSVCQHLTKHLWPRNESQLYQICMSTGGRIQGVQRYSLTRKISYLWKGGKVENQMWGAFSMNDTLELL